ncbi:MAG TPA: DUF4132 domain-containing protein [Streptosporangiaceae bacterium]|nr:DUF4132 domain-containing protein [Streptosporangiaceae bacterium]
MRGPGESPGSFAERLERQAEQQAAWQRQWDAWHERAKAEAPEVTGSLLLLAVRQATTTARQVITDRAVARDLHSEAAFLLANIEWLKSRRYVVDRSDAIWAVRAAARLPDSRDSGAVISFALMLASQCRPKGGPHVDEALRKLAASLPQLTLPAPDRAKSLAEIRKVLPAPPPDGPVDCSVIVADDRWSAVLLQELGAWTGATSPVNNLLRHLALATGSNPGKAWMSAATRLLAAQDGVRLLRLILEAVATATRAPEPMMDFVQVGPLLSYDNTDLVRAAAWVAAAVNAEWVVPTLQATAHRGIHGTNDDGYVASAKVPNAAIHSLGAIATPEAIAALQQLQRSTRHAGFRKQIAAALSAAARRTGLTPSQLIERVVPAAGLDPDGHRLVTAHGTRATARVLITSDLRVRAEWQTPAGWAAKRPAGVGNDLAAAVRTAIKEVKGALTGERARVEGLFAGHRCWSLADWSKLYLDHPVTGPLSRTLVWTIETSPDASTTGDAVPAEGTADPVSAAAPSRVVTGIPGPDRAFRTLDGSFPIPDAGTVRLWHPARASTDEVRRWRDQLADAPFPQPFKQAFREVYLLTPAELRTSRGIAAATPYRRENGWWCRP